MSSDQSWRPHSWAPLVFLISGLSEGTMVFLRKFILAVTLAEMMLRWKTWFDFGVFHFVTMDGIFLASIFYWMVRMFAKRVCEATGMAHL